MRRIGRIRLASLLASTAALGFPLVLFSGSALANCTTLGGITTCDADAPNPWTTRVGAGNTAAGDNQTVDVQTGATIQLGNDNAISLRDNADITIGSGATVQNAATTTSGQYGTGGNTIETRNNGSITIDQGGQLLAIGTQNSAEAINFQGTGNVVENSGLIRADNAVAIWSQNTSGLNTVVNTGTGIIQAREGSTSTVIGGSGNGALDFTNRGIVRGSISLAGGNDILRLFTGSTVTGNFSGGAGNDQIFLSGAGNSSLPGNFVGFESLIKNDPGTWTLTGTINGVTVATIQQGTLALTGNNSNYTGQIIVDPAGTLEARAQSLPPTVTDNGLVRFAQTDNGLYAGTITGNGAIQKTGAGTLTLSGSTNIAGSTALDQGTLVLAAGGTLATSGVTMAAATTLQIDGTLTDVGGGPASIAGGAGSQTLIVNGSFTGNANLGDGDDRLDIAGAASGTFDQGDGNDYAIIRSGAVLQGGQLAQGAGNDTLDVFGTIAGDVIQGDDDDCVTVGSGGQTGGISQGAGNDCVTVAGGSVNGNVDQGDNDDTFIMNSGTVAGAVDQGGGNDSAQIHGGVIAGNLQQGAGVDDFLMDGGQLGSLNQGDGRDTFTMSGGHIVGAFEDGDVAVMIGGRIGRVDMKLDKNLFDMSGGVIDGNLVTGFDQDTVIVSGTSFIGGNISVSGGADSVTVTGGTVGGEVRMSTGNDTFRWSDSGTIQGAVLLAEDDDTATLSNLSDAATLSATPQIDGGNGVDLMSWSNVQASGPERFTGWETFSLTNVSALTFASTLTLGDAGTGTGALTIDPTSTVFAGAGTHSIEPFTAGQLVTVTNAGAIDLTNGGNSTADSLTIAGNYTSQNGRLQLQSVLASDNAPSDKLIIDSGTAVGFTGIGITNVGGAGALTLSNGILVVEAINGATTTTNAFTLSRPAAAGPFEYYLFKGGVTGGTQENWYLRNTVIYTGPPPAPLPPDEIAPPFPTPTDPSLPRPVQPPPPTPGARPFIGPVIPLYRREVPNYAVVPPVARQAAVATLGTFHERRGEQSVLTPGENFSAAWGRVFGQSIDGAWEGTVSPSIDGSLFGIQAGLDLLRQESESGHRDTAGVFIGQTKLSGDINGFAVGWYNLAVGEVDLDMTSIGAYWTHIGPQGWYVDGVLMGSFFGGDAASTRGIGIDLSGGSVTASLEGGYPIPIAQDWALEPQAQIIWQHLSFDDQNDGFSNVAFDTYNGFTGRVGARLQGSFQTRMGLLQPYLKANIWHEFEGTDDVLLDGFPISTTTGGTTLEFGGGLVASVTEDVSIYGTSDYTFDVDGKKWETFEGNLGLRVKW